ncbi:hypothetical protein IQ276_005920 [Desmonostoc muscorum LEGE 12446]|uniref:Uncharacterized protein n=1 Tax=Desmonostoc muscorum LEGE 12446 TaxID=1828758 RepID=A0A8J7D2E2_DESMC|nr:hypothetical protein [Desmonostoc muscorum]MCF2145999.1 hypothetical protein [Desmonostoc muscorum LEGE 12446]
MRSLLSILLVRSLILSIREESSQLIAIILLSVKETSYVSVQLAKVVTFSRRNTGF